MAIYGCPLDSQTMDASKVDVVEEGLTIEKTLVAIESFLPNHSKPSDSSKSQVLTESLQYSVLRKELEQQIMARDKRLESLSKEYVKKKAKIQKYKNKLQAEKRVNIILKSTYYQCVNENQKLPMFSQDLSTNTMS